MHLGSQGEVFERRRELQLQHERGKDEKVVIAERELATTATEDSLESGSHDHCGDISLERMAFQHCENRPWWD